VEVGVIKTVQLVAVVLVGRVVTVSHPNLHWEEVDLVE
jgi:hypothetical protein